MIRKPLSQGDEDGLCGLYSIINALTLLFPMTMVEDMQRRVFKVIASACSAWPDILWDGTTEADIRAMLTAARGGLHKTFSWEQPFRHHAFNTFDEFRHDLKRRIAGEDCFAVVGISKPWEHWTCAHRLTEHEMIMTDSCHVKQIPLAKCGFAGDGTEYEFDFKQTFTLLREVHNG